MTFSTHSALRADGTPSDVGLIYLDQVDVAKLRTPFDVVHDSGVIDLIELWTEQDGIGVGGVGRPREIPIRSVLVLMAMLAIDNQPMHLTKARDIICDRATDNALKTLGFPARNETDYKSLKGRKQWYDKLWHAYHAILRVVDPFPEMTYKRRLTKEEYAELVATRNPDLVEARRQRLTLFNNRLIMAAAKLIGEEEFNRWEGDVAVDGTPIKAARIGSARGARRVSSEPDAGWYVREGNHDGSQEDDPYKTMWAYEATLAVMTFSKTDDEMPSLLLGMALDKPGHNIGKRAQDALSHIINDSEMPKGYFIGDRAYLPNSKSENLAIPLRLAGYKMIGDQRGDSLGFRMHYQGADLIDGTWYLAGMPKNLVNAGVDFHTGRIDEVQFAARIEKRKLFELRIKTVTQDGTTVFYNPANYGKYTTVLVPGVKRPENFADTAVKVFEKDLPPKAQRSGLLKGNKTLRIPLEIGAKYAQQGPAWATNEWASIYHRGRNTIESRNDLLKSGRYSSIGDQTTRMIRGFAANAVFVALGAVSVNVGLIKRYLHRLVIHFDTPKPPTPPETRRVTDEFLSEIQHANAPPQVA
ncbi:hypothetical protein [Corynebacterium ureicelerivorans]|uniref:Uncharacterized protein n=1 Tax=Corynebacterium ureicelerivorans TaxID=401472 RepID=A0A077HPC1_9CORY|nr:hypothetical protein [Corynebacterium ureicelerivorans]AIL96477.1 hypothetical protein CUREI_03470 [Corynebacterium ureicelerivorans]